MAPIALTSETFKSTIEENPLVVLDFWATWCGPCRGFAPVFERVAAVHPGVVFAKVDIEQAEVVALALGVMAVPTIVVFRGGQEVFRHSGVLGEGALEECVARARSQS